MAKEFNPNFVKCPYCEKVLKGTEVGKHPLGGVVPGAAIVHVVRFRCDDCVPPIEITTTVVGEPKKKG